MHTRYLWTAAGSDLQDAIDTLQAAADTPTGPVDRADRLSNLGNVLRLRAVRGRSTEAADAAVRTLQEADRLTAPDSAAKAGRLSNLGSALLTRAEITEDPADLEAAVHALTHALSVTAADSAHRAHYLSNLGNAMLRQGRAGEAAANHRAALALLPPGHPDRITVQGNLVTALIAEAEKTGDESILGEATAAIDEAVSGPDGSPHDRVLALWRHADLLVRRSGGNAAAGLQSMLRATELAERVAFTGVAPTDRQYALSRFATLAEDAAAAALTAGRLGTAIEQLELGRGVGWREQLRTRTGAQLSS
ncbi:hypothetical protein CF165_42465 [Amycolatopsis vastitatis]|uniref:Tetratricopeptide repeat protein n=1 Tax=Amycolatopsis vastitatis TaxID=1905142 RepID=A0A229SPB0_9PSEU|nr:hypothetical protein CF165_42465 [Amycolatopsis vastitatis]